MLSVVPVRSLQRDALLRQAVSERARVGERRRGWRCRQLRMMSMSSSLLGGAPWRPGQMGLVDAPQTRAGDVQAYYLVWCRFVKMQMRSVWV